MNALSIIAHSMRQFTGNIGAAIRISLPLFAIANAISLYLFPAWALTAQQPDGQPPLVSASVWTRNGILFAIHGGAALWIAVAWHRYLLLAERGNGLFPRFYPARMAVYLVGCLALLLVAGIGFVFATAAVLTLPALLGHFSNVPPLVAAVVMFGAAAPIGILMLRLMTALPGIAVGDQALRPVWDATRDQWQTFLALLAMLVAAAALILGVAHLLTSAIPLVGLLYALAAKWIALMFSLTLITTLYGHYAQKRLPDVGA